MDIFLIYKHVMNHNLNLIKYSKKEIKSKLLVWKQHCIIQSPDLTFEQFISTLLPLMSSLAAGNLRGISSAMSLLLGLETTTAFELQSVIV